MVDEGVVGLIGLVAALLSRDSSIKQSMDDSTSQEVVEEIINREVRIFLKLRETIAIDNE